MRTDSQPCQRAVVLKLSLTTIAEHPRRAELEAALPAELREAIEVARPSEWLPIERAIALIEVMWGVLGREEFIAFYLRQSERSREDSTIGRLLAGVTTLFNPSPATRLRHLQRGFDLIQRDIGDMRVIVEANDEATLVIEGLPLSLRKESYAISMVGALQFAVGHDNHEIDVEADMAKLERGRVDYRIRWRGRAVA